MDPCVPGAATADARTFARVHLGVPHKYANKMTAKQVCKAIKACKNTNIMPPMDYTVFDGKGYLIDPETPLSIEDYIALFKKGDLVKIQKIARKLGLVPATISKKELVNNIVAMLKSFKFAEPIELPSKRTRNARLSMPEVPYGNTGLPGSNGNAGGGEEPEPEPEPEEREEEGQFGQANPGMLNAAPPSSRNSNSGTGVFHTPNPGRLSNNSSSDNFKSTQGFKWPWQARNSVTVSSSSNSQNVSEQLRNLKEQANKASNMLKDVKQDVVGPSTNTRLNTIRNAVNQSLNVRARTI